jgi:hypothetical protein
MGMITTLLFDWRDQRAVRLRSPGVACSSPGAERGTSHVRSEEQGERKRKNIFVDPFFVEERRGPVSLQISAGIKIDLTHSGFDGQPPQMPSAVIASALRAWRRLLHFARNDDA